MPKSKLKTIPKFANEDEERAFWADHDSTDYVDWSRSKRAESSSGLPRSIFPGEAIDRNGSRALVRVPGRDRPCPGW